MTGRSSREKGKRGEREVAGRLRDIFGECVVRGWQAAGPHSPDVDTPYFWVEVKRRRRVNIMQALRQATDERNAADDNRTPIAVCRQDREPPTVTLWWDDFLDFIEDWHKRGMA